MKLNPRAPWFVFPQLKPPKPHLSLYSSSYCSHCSCVWDITYARICPVCALPLTEIPAHQDPATLLVKRLYCPKHGILTAKHIKCFRTARHLLSRTHYLGSYCAFCNAPLTCSQRTHTHTGSS